MSRRRCRSRMSRRRIRSRRSKMGTGAGGEIGAGGERG